MLEFILGPGNISLDLIFHLVILSLVLTAIICFIDFCRRPWGISRRLSRTLRRWEICNAQREYPKLKCVRKCKQRSHELILELDGKGLSLLDFDKHLEHFKVGLNGAIRMEYGDKNTTIRLYYLPRKYVRPTGISPADDAIGAIGVQRLINLLLIGPTGTGKTVTLKIIISKISRFSVPGNSATPANPPCLWLLDFKQIDFHNFINCPHYYGYTDCLQGLKDCYAAFKEQQKAGIIGNPNYLVIDEWGSFIMSLDKKSAEEAKNMLAELLMLGRAYQFIPIVGIQRPDASYFNGGRDNFQTIIALGNLSPEGRRMVFPDSVKEQITDCKQREGHLYIDGIGLEKIRIEDISDMDALDKSILDAMSR